MRVETLKSTYLISLLGNMAKNVLATVMRRDEAVSFSAAKGFHNTGNHWIFHGTRWAVFVVVGFVFVRVRARVCASKKEEEQTIKSMPDEKVGYAWLKAEQEKEKEG